MRRPASAVALALLLPLFGCSSEQDPGLTPAPAGGTETTSRPLQPCPEGGPDATTPAAGCLADDGSVVRP